MSNPRLRFAPSPTGYLHLGGARTALFSWLWARRQRGAFVLRIEDTDTDRNLDESRGAIVESLRWLGLGWDEGPEVGGAHGPYRQSERQEIYRSYAQKLLATRRAYRCYCTPEELAAAREAHRNSGSREAFRYPGTCRDRRDHPDKPYVLRLRAPSEGSTGWVDRVKGRIDVPNSTQQDFVLMRRDGRPLYNFSCVVDDLEMGISLVARGDDHVVNSAPQLLIYEALGAQAPEFAHLPMILAPNGEKLSKRHAAVSVLEYRDLGYLPDAVNNYLARLGWSHGDQEIFQRHELVELFDWAQVGRKGARYDAKKFAYVQAEHLRACPARELAEQIAPALKIDLHSEANREASRLELAIEQARSRATTLIDLREAIAFAFVAELSFEEKAVRKFLKPEAAARLRALAERIGPMQPFRAPELEATVKAWLEEQGMALKDVAQPARVALTGRSKSPGLFEVMELLGREQTLRRLECGAQMASTQASDLQGSAS